MKSQTGSAPPAREPDRSLCRGTIGPSSRLLACGFVVFASLFLLGCPTKLVQVRVQAEDVIRANEAAKEADLAFLRKDHYAALIKYLEAARYNPNSEYIYNKLGISYSQLRYNNEAIAAFQRSIALNPNYPYSYNNLGSVYFAVDDIRKAEQDFNK